MSERPRTRGIEIVLIIALGLMILGAFSGLLFGGGLLLAPVRSSWIYTLPALTGIGFLIQILLAIWVGVDAGKRGMSGLLWGLLVLLTPLIGLLIYLIVAHAMPGAAREPAAATATANGAPSGSCGACGKEVRPGFRVCPFCGEALRGSCPSCSRPSESGWKVCPYCSTSLTG